MTTRWVSRMSYVERYASLSDYLCLKCLNMPQEWIPSLPLHLDLYASLKIAPPTFGHMPILLNPDGSKMSKRHGDVQVIDFIVRITSIIPPPLLNIQLQKRGWEPDAVLNWLLHCGYGVHHDTSANAGSTPPKESTESMKVMKLDEMVDKV